MTNQKALEILKKESGCRHLDDEDCQIIETNSCEGCEFCYGAMPNGEDPLTQAIDTAIEALELLVSMEDDGR